MSDFTPGPWRADGEMIQCQSTWYDNEGEHVDWKYPRILAHVVDDWDYEANARLMAAAPDLLSALIAAKQEMWMAARAQWTMADFKNWAVIQQIDAALQKADGKQRVEA